MYPSERCNLPYWYVQDKIKVSIHINACNFCPVGFKQSSDDVKGCKCICDSALEKYIVSCNYSTGTVMKHYTTAWISYVDNSSGYLIYPYCPHNYCLPPETMVQINLNIPNGSDAQCNHNRAGLLCGACVRGSTLSLGSTHYY